ncbi:hypothetical protein [Cytobacillus oceanisediminis]|nr:hypothetical protein [Cytobacillus oceanisediminis]
MREDNIHFITAGENLAYGQFSCIFAYDEVNPSLLGFIYQPFE